MAQWKKHSFDGVDVDVMVSRKKARDEGTYYEVKLRRKGGKEISREIARDTAQFGTSFVNWFDMDDPDVVYGSTQDLAIADMVRLYVAGDLKQGSKQKR